MAVPVRVTGGVGLIDTVNPVFQTITLATNGGFLYESAADNVVAGAGGGRVNAVALTSEMTRVSVVATTGDSVSLPRSVAGLTVILENASAKALQVYGDTVATINNQPFLTGVSQMGGSVVIYTCYAFGAWYANGLGTGYSGSLETMSSVNGITAFAGGGQASAAPLTAMMNRITTIATAGDSVILPVSTAGLQILTINATAVNALAVFPSGTDAINALAASTAFSLPASKTATFYCVNAGQWHTMLSA